MGGGAQIHVDSRGFTWIPLFPRNLATRLVSMTAEPAPTPPALPDGSGQRRREESEPATMGQAARLVGVFFSPGKTFADIARRPTWWVPIIVMAILGTIYLNAFTQRVGWESVIRPAIERAPNTQNLPPQQREQIIERAAGLYKYLGYGGSA